MCSANITVTCSVDLKMSVIFWRNYIKVAFMPEGDAKIEQLYPFSNFQLSKFHFILANSCWMFMSGVHVIYVWLTCSAVAEHQADGQCFIAFSDQREVLSQGGGLWSQVRSAVAAVSRWWSTPYITAARWEAKPLFRCRTSESANVFTIWWYEHWQLCPVLEKWIKNPFLPVDFPL